MLLKSCMSVCRFVFDLDQLLFSVLTRPHARSPWLDQWNQITPFKNAVLFSTFFFSFLLNPIKLTLSLSLSLYRTIHLKNNKHKVIFSSWNKEETCPVYTINSTAKSNNLLYTFCETLIIRWWCKTEDKPRSHRWTMPFLSFSCTSFSLIHYLIPLLRFHQWLTMLVNIEYIVRPLSIVDLNRAFLFFSSSKTKQMT